MTLLEKARNGILPDEILRAAKEEGVAPERMRKLVAEGRAVIPRNRVRGEIRPVAIGEGLRGKVNANVGPPGAGADISLELEKMRAAVAAGADAVMDLSTGGPIDEIRRAILAQCPEPIRTVPLPQTAA